MVIFRNNKQETFRGKFLVKIKYGKEITKYNRMVFVSRGYWIIDLCYNYMDTKNEDCIRIKISMEINNKNILYMKKVYTLGDSFYWRVMARFVGDKKETCLIRVLTESEADKFIEYYSP